MMVSGNFRCERPQGAHIRSLTLKHSQLEGYLMTNNEAKEALSKLPEEQVNKVFDLLKEGWIIMDIVNSMGDKKIVELTRIHPDPDKHTISQYKDVYYDGEASRAVQR